MFYRLLRIQAFIIGAVLFAALLAFGWLVQHLPAILKVIGLIGLGFLTMILLGVVVAAIDLQALKRRDPAAYEARMRASRQRLENVKMVRRLAATSRASAGLKTRSLQRHRKRRR